jgi:hypothetical protein
MKNKTHLRNRKKERIDNKNRNSRRTNSKYSTLMYIRMKNNNKLKELL